MADQSEILIVEDDVVFRQTMQNMLISKFPSITVTNASNGKEAFEKLEGHCPNLIIMDIELRGKSGLVLTKEIKTAYPHMVVIILTNHDLPEYREVALQNGADYFLSKETTKGMDVLSLIKTVIESEKNKPDEPG